MVPLLWFVYPGMKFPLRFAYSMSDIAAVINGEISAPPNQSQVSGFGNPNDPPTGPSPTRNLQPPPAQLRRSSSNSSVSSGDSEERAYIQQVRCLFAPDVHRDSAD